MKVLNSILLISITTLFIAGCLGGSKVVNLSTVEERVGASQIEPTRLYVGLDNNLLTCKRGEELALFTTTDTTGKTVEFGIKNEDAEEMEVKIKDSGEVFVNGEELTEVTLLSPTYTVNSKEFARGDTFDVRLQKDSQGKRQWYLWAGYGAILGDINFVENAKDYAKVSGIEDRDIRILETRETRYERIVKEEDPKTGKTETISSSEKVGITVVDEKTHRAIAEVNLRLGSAVFYNRRGYPVFYTGTKKYETGAAYLSDKLCIFKDIFIGEEKSGKKPQYERIMGDIIAWARERGDTSLITLVIEDLNAVNEAAKNIDTSTSKVYDIVERLQKNQSLGEVHDKGSITVEDWFSGKTRRIRDIEIDLMQLIRYETAGAYVTGIEYGKYNATRGLTSKGTTTLTVSIDKEDKDIVNFTYYTRNEKGEIDSEVTLGTDSKGKVWIEVPILNPAINSAYTNNARGEERFYGKKIRIAFEQGDVAIGKSPERRIELQYFNEKGKLIGDDLRHHPSTPSTPVSEDK